MKRFIIFGAGYVGQVTGARLLKRGHAVTFIDIDPETVEALFNGETTLAEPGIRGPLQEAISGNRLRAAGSVDDLGPRREWDAGLVCVGTGPDGEPEMEPLMRCARTSADLGADRAKYLTIIRTTIPPQRMHKVSNVMREEPWAYVPEFFREGTALADAENPPLSVIGAERMRWSARASDLLRFDGMTYDMSPREAAFVKLSSNAWHAMKVAFANEIGRTADKFEGVDPSHVMEVFRKDTRLNISEAYLRPGPAYGGSCLPKDVQMLQLTSRRSGAKTPLLEAINESNNREVERALGAIGQAIAKRQEQEEIRVFFLGMAFKSGTNDLRNSPAVMLANSVNDLTLTRVETYDRNVRPSDLAALSAPYGKLHETCVADPVAAIQAADIVVLCHQDETYLDLLHGTTRSEDIVDLTRTIDIEARNGDPMEEMVNGLTREGLINTFK